MLQEAGCWSDSVESVGSESRSPLRLSEMLIVKQGGLLTRPPKEFGETSRGKQKISQAQQCDTDVGVL